MIFIYLYLVGIVVYLLIAKRTSKHWKKIETPQFVFWSSFVWPILVFMVIYDLIVGWLAK